MLINILTNYIFELILEGSTSNFTITYLFQFHTFSAASIHILVVSVAAVTTVAAVAVAQTGTVAQTGAVAVAQTGAVAVAQTSVAVLEVGTV